MMIEPTRWIGGLDRFCDAMIAIRNEIAEIEKAAGRSGLAAAPCPHTVTHADDAWARAYSARGASRQHLAIRYWCRWAASTTSMATAIWCALAGLLRASRG
jgi:glycine dehydrogenase